VIETFHCGPVEAAGSSVPTATPDVPRGTSVADDGAAGVCEGLDVAATDRSTTGVRTGLLAVEAVDGRRSSGASSAGERPTSLGAQAVSTSNTIATPACRIEL
jgi:hypothetical protein